MKKDKYRVGQLRPSQILFTYGVGAIADLMNFSVIVMGLDEWEQYRCLEISEERLLAFLQKSANLPVKKLLSPPIPEEGNNSSDPWSEANRLGIPVAPFPTWMVCPQCRLLATIQSGLFKLKVDRYSPEKTHYVHENCKAKKPPKVLPVRFLVACENGHLDDFPWLYFVHQGHQSCPGPLRLKEYGVSGATTDIKVSCDNCGKSRVLSDAFGESAKQNLPRCRGRHPHLRDFDESCPQQMRAILLGASNSWFSITKSALSLPKASTKLEKLVAENWTSLDKATNLEVLQILLQAFQATGHLQTFADYSTEEIWQVIEAKRQGTQQEDFKDLKTPEWQVFANPESAQDSPYLQLRTVPPPKGFEKYFTDTVLVEKLREVRALIGFTRIQSPGDFTDAGQAVEEYQVRIARQALSWVPASEVKGEGIFLRFQEKVLQAWEGLEPVQKRLGLARVAYRDWLNARGLDPDKGIFPGMRYLLIHSFSHALMRQLAIDCGYSAASLTERIYCQLPTDEFGPQAGVLIYTSAADSEGTLGGLVSLGEPQVLGYHIAMALESMKLCTSDPLCAEHQATEGNPSLHWAACHACLFAPETACERGNKFLDRSLLVPTVGNGDLAFWSSI